MNQKNIQITFILLAFLIYFFLSNLYKPDYIKVEQIYKINKKEKIHHEAILYTNQTCIIDVENFDIIKKIINDIDKNHINYFTRIKKKSSNSCEKPKTLLSITIDYIFINILHIFFSFLLSLLFICLSFELVELINIIKFVKLDKHKKNDNICSNIDNDLTKDNEIDYEIIEINETYEINEIDKINKIDEINKTDEINKINKN